jgi:hypothetical protein
MYKVNAREPEIRLISNGKDQEISTFTSYKEFLDWLPKRFSDYSLRIVDHFPTHEYNKYFIDEDHKPIFYIVRDEFGNVITTDKIKKDKEELYNYERRQQAKRNGYLYFKQHEGMYIYRYDPIPGIYNGKHSHSFRHVKTTQEKRMNERDKMFVRGRRSSKNLPSSWDDIIIKSREDTCWKKFRKHQWKN